MAKNDYSVSAKEERYIDKVRKMIDESKHESYIAGVNDGLNIYPILYHLLLNIREIISPSFTESFGELSVSEVLRVHSVNYIISCLKFWRSYWTDELADDDIQDDFDEIFSKLS